ncbi:MAG: hypothetical protein GF334_00715 [Candidatus Altiarchaeales archaeon]|nr:hypothetical protein [Candidatus Altiarchaeales archaeon]
MEKEAYQRLIREFRRGDLTLCKRVLDEALRHGDYDLAQEALDAMKNGKKTLVMKTEYQRGRVLTYLRGPKGAVQFMAMVHPNLEDEYSRDFRMVGADVGYHSFTPMYEGMESMGSCEILDGAECYYDGSGLRATEVLPKIIEGGEEWLREFLEEEYRMTFGE